MKGDSAQRMVHLQKYIVLYKDIYRNVEMIGRRGGGAGPVQLEIFLIGLS